MNEPPVRRTCQWVQARLHRVIDGTYPARRGELLLRHVRRCARCADELARQRKVAEGLRGLGAARQEPEVDAPRELLETILQRIHEPGVRERVAGPARGAVSGARPELSAAALLVVLVVVYLAWRVARELVERFDADA